MTQYSKPQNVTQDCNISSPMSHGWQVRRGHKIEALRVLWPMDNIIPGPGLLYTEEQFKLKRAFERAAMPTLDRSTYLEKAVDGSPERTLTLFPGGLMVDGNHGPVAKPGRGGGGKFTPKPAKRGGGLRGKVRGKSRQSRRRQMVLMMKIRPTGPGQFVTLTLSDAPLRAGWSSQQVLDAIKGADGWLVRFAKAVFYRWPGAVILWGEELQDRKSGQFKGAIMPHLHLIIFGAELSEGWVKKTWADICGFGDEQHEDKGADVQELDSRRKILSYVSKYTGKEQSCRGDNQTGELLDTGRMWGVMYGPGARDDYGKPNILHEGVKLKVSDNELVQLKRLIKRWLKVRGKSGRKYGRWLTTSSTGLGWSLFGLGLDDMAGVTGLDGTSNDVRALLRWDKLLEQCFEAGRGSRG